MSISGDILSSHQDSSVSTSKLSPWQKAPFSAGSFYLLPAASMQNSSAYSMFLLNYMTASSCSLISLPSGMWPKMLQNSLTKQSYEDRDSLPVFPNCCGAFPVSRTAWFSADWRLPLGQRSTGSIAQCSFAWKLFGTGYKWAWWCTRVLLWHENLGDSTGELVHPGIQLT